MRIQHNVTAMNAYRNYNNNTTAINKNLEKLSSGYKINRAGDDAAGLAVSQKMRLQIAGLTQAQKNAKSGISLVQTAEGALQEVHEMLERMYTIAEQSANGTFDSTTDRTQLQKELDSLRTEIDRIGKTANFNGIGLFSEYDGASGVTGGKAAVLSSKDVVNPTNTKVTATAGADDAKASMDFSVAGVDFKKSGTVSVEIAGKLIDVEVQKGMDAASFAAKLKDAYDSGDGIGDGQGGTFAMEVNGAKVTLTASKKGVANDALLKAMKKDVVIGAEKPAESNTYDPTAEADVSGIKSAADGVSAPKLTFTVNDEMSDEAKAAFNEAIGSGQEITLKTSTANFNDDNVLTVEGFDDLLKAGYTVEVTDKAGATKGAITEDSSKLTFVSGAGDATKNTVKADTNVLNFVIKDKYGETAATIKFDAAVTQDDGSTDARLTANGTATLSLTAGTPTESTGNFTKDGKAISDVPALVDMTTGGAAEIADTKNINWSSPDQVGKDLADKTLKLTMGGQTFELEFVKTAGNLDEDKVAAGKQLDMTKVMIDSPTQSMSYSELRGQIEKALQKQADAAAATAEGGKEDYIKIDNIKMEATVDGSFKITYDQQKMAYKDSKSGKGVGADEIWFAIGAEANDNNKLTLGSMHLGPKVIGMDDAATTDISELNIADQDEAWAAMDVINSATNAVSDMRGTLGATQNRLEHTIKNLSVMQENMQDAESVIRDTDVAEEMMAYTKNNILVQSAQAMLAQANQLPQGVLQLLG